MAQSDTQQKMVTITVDGKKLQAPECAMLPGLLTWPETENSFTPPLLVIPISANHFAPLRMIAGTDASVSVLLIVVGLPYKPKLAGKGGLKRGRPFSPSREFNKAVSSPQI